jgi:hypothetical protein
VVPQAAETAVEPAPAAATKASPPAAAAAAPLPARSPTRELSAAVPKQPEAVVATSPTLDVQGMKIDQGAL